MSTFLSNLGTSRNDSTGAGYPVVRGKRLSEPVKFKLWLSCTTQLQDDGSSQILVLGKTIPNSLSQPLMVHHAPLSPPRHKHQTTAIPLVELLHPKAPLIPLQARTAHQRNPPQALPTPQHLIHSAQQPSPQSLLLILLQDIDIRHVRKSHVVSNQPR